MHKHETNETNRQRWGAVYSLGAFISWGLFPLYFQFIVGVSTLEVVVQRAAWSLLFVLCVLAWRRQWAWLGESFQQPKRLLLFTLTGGLVMCNWMTYVYAVQNQQIAEASLGYFINPLVSVLLGVVVLKERLRALQKVAVALASCGVLWLTYTTGRLPWIALLLAASFGLYGLLRKTAPLGALEGLALETLLLTPLTIPALVWLNSGGTGALLHSTPGQIALLLLLGPMTALPLLLFAAGARRLPLSTLGMTQYLSPTVQLLLAVVWFNEPFNATRLAGFVFIWAALALFSTDAWRAHATPKSAPSVGPNLAD
jgi:chloramphenicol-sensitive protein RarD